MLYPLGRLPRGKRLARIQASKNFRHGKFQNLVPTSTIAEGASYVKMMVDFFKKDATRQPTIAIPSIKTDLKKLPTENTSIVWFGHSSYLIHIQNKNILVDPVFSDRPSPVKFAGSKSFPGSRVFSEDDLPEVDVILITHDHYDHFDYNTIVKLLKRKPALFIAPLGVGEHLEYWGADPKNIIELDWWERATPLPGFEVIATPARHFSGRGLSRDKTLWTSYVLKTETQNLFIGGDSGYDDAFKDIGNTYGPFDIALLECGQYDLQWPYIHMMPEETVKASMDLKAKVLLPVHWGKFTLGLHSWKDPIQRAVKEAQRLGVKITTPKIGEPVILDSVLPNSQWWEKIS